MKVEVDCGTEYQKAIVQKPKMSASQAAKLRAIKEQDKANREASNRLVEQFYKLPHDVHALIQVLRRIIVAPAPTQDRLERIAIKLRWSVAHGWRAFSSHDLVFLGELTREEETMSDEQFVRHLEQSWPEAVEQTAAMKLRRGVRPSRVAKERVWGGLDRPKSDPEVPVLSMA
jgi:hypothetical protein